MPLVTFLPHEKFCPEGLTVEVEPGTNILELAHDHHIEMVPAAASRPAPPAIASSARVSTRWKKPTSWKKTCWTRLGLEAQSRLGCPVVVADQDTVIEIPQVFAQPRRRSAALRFAP